MRSGGAGTGGTFTIALSSGAGGDPGQFDRAVVLGHQDHFVAGLYARIHGRIDLRALGGEKAHHGAFFVGGEDFAEGLTHEGRLFFHVDFVTIEVE